ncbi:MAG: hypothetical protein Q8P67_14325 [archaeon]|nr:hypothetical protein [archaeon]
MAVRLQDVYVAAETSWKDGCGDCFCCPCSPTHARQQHQGQQKQHQQLGHPRFFKPIRINGCSGADPVYRKDGDWFSIERSNKRTAIPSNHRRFCGVGS